MKSINDIIVERKSVRTFDATRQMSARDAATLRQTLAESTSPFGGTANIELKEFALDGAFKPSTYGTINGASWYFLMGTDSKPDSQLTLGFRMEQVVLKATSMGFGTCWIAATFKGTAFAQQCSLPPDTPLQVIMPVGYPAQKMKLRERLTRVAIGSAKRKPFNDLFINAENTKFQLPLEMMRLAPSSTNSQPWRAMVDGDNVYFYYVDKSKASVLDLGIGLCHFFLTAKEQGLQGSLRLCSDAPEHPGWIPVACYSL